ncbi:hypothetical protein BHE74_00027121 [Ensete ventricosum]|nr:hypothetical protein BHE74_00027121 [Ensete ventricosum]
MRTGACTLQQALTAEAASVLKHSLSLARQRGHAQVTPLHVAATLLSSSSSASNLLRRACLKSQPHHPASHPLRCRALELCFNLCSQQSAPFPAPSSHKEDLNAVLEVMLRKQGRRTNAVVVGDSISMTEGIVAELMAKIERGDVPDELKAAHFIKLQLSYVHLRLMSRSDVDLKVSDLRRKLGSLASDRVGGCGLIIYAGDLRWAVDEETKDGRGFMPVEHMVAELGRLLSECRNSSVSNGGATVNNKVWLLATASYQTYMRCQTRLETRWNLQAVVVPSGGLALSLQAPR